MPDNDLNVGVAAPQPTTFDNITIVPYPYPVYGVNAYEVGENVAPSIIKHKSEPKNTEPIDSVALEYYITDSYGYAAEPENKTSYYDRWGNLQFKPRTYPTIELAVAALDNFKSKIGFIASGTEEKEMGFTLNRPSDHDLSRSDTEQTIRYHTKPKVKPLLKFGHLERAGKQVTNTIPPVWDGSIGMLGGGSHYPSVSKDGTYIEFYEDDIKLALDERTSMLPGRYLKKYATWMNDEDIKRWVDLHKLSFGKEAPEVKFAKTPEEITYVYTLPFNDSSCMQGEFKRTPVHPASVYGAGDLAIAYIERDGRLLARALMWPEKKRLGRVYGSRTVLIKGLYALGYDFSKQNNYDMMHGARLLKIKTDSGKLVVPYIDSNRRYSSAGILIEPDHLELCDYGDFIAHSTSGFLERYSVCCVCNREVSSLESKPYRTTTRNHRRICNVCFNKKVSSAFLCSKDRIVYDIDAKFEKIEVITAKKLKSKTAIPDIRTVIWCKQTTETERIEKFGTHIAKAALPYIGIDHKNRKVLTKDIPKSTDLFKERIRVA